MRIWNSDSGALSNPSLYLNVSLRSRYELSDEMKCKIWHWQAVVSTEMQLWEFKIAAPWRNYSPADPITVFHLEIKADSGEKRREKGGIWQARAFICKGSGRTNWEQHLKELQCDSALTWTTKQSRVERVTKTNTKASAMATKTVWACFCQSPVHHPSPQQS